MFGRHIPTMAFKPVRGGVEPTRRVKETTSSGGSSSDGGYWSRIGLRQKELGRGRGCYEWRGDEVGRGRIESEIRSRVCARRWGVERRRQRRHHFVAEMRISRVVLFTAVDSTGWLFSRANGRLLSVCFFRCLFSRTRGFAVFPFISVSIIPVKLGLRKLAFNGLPVASSVLTSTFCKSSLVELAVKSTKLLSIMFDRHSVSKTTTTNNSLFIQPALVSLNLYGVGNLIIPSWKRKRKIKLLENSFESEIGKSFVFSFFLNYYYYFN